MREYADGGLPALGHVLGAATCPLGGGWLRGEAALAEAILRVVGGGSEAGGHGPGEVAGEGCGDPQPVVVRDGLGHTILVFLRVVTEYGAGSSVGKGAVGEADWG